TAISWYFPRRLAGLRERMTITRRDALLRTAALASASLLPAVPVLAARPRSVDIGKWLQAAVTAHEIPGVVAMAANGDSILYEGAIGLRGACADAAMSIDTIFR